MGAAQAKTKAHGRLVVENRRLALLCRALVLSTAPRDGGGIMANSYLSFNPESAHAFCIKGLDLKAQAKCPQK